MVFRKLSLEKRLDIAGKVILDLHNKGHIETLCPVCGTKIHFSGDYNRSYSMHCATKGCFDISCRGI